MNRLGYKGDILYYGSVESDWVGFYSPIVHVELTSDGVFKVQTELGEYELYYAGDQEKMYVKDMKGVSIFELQREHMGEDGKHVNKYLQESYESALRENERLLEENKRLKEERDSFQRVGIKSMEEVKSLMEYYEHAQKAIYTQHCTMNHMENTEYEKGQINGLIQASNLLRNSFKEALREDGNGE